MVSMCLCEHRRASRWYPGRQNGAEGSPIFGNEKGLRGADVRHQVTTQPFTSWIPLTVPTALNRLLSGVL